MELLDDILAQNYPRILSVAHYFSNLKFYYLCSRRKLKYENQIWAKFNLKWRVFQQTSPDQSLMFTKFTDSRINIKKTLNRGHMRETRLEGIELSGLRGLNSALWETQRTQAKIGVLWCFWAKIESCLIIWNPSAMYTEGRLLEPLRILERPQKILWVLSDWVSIVQCWPRPR